MRSIDGLSRMRLNPTRRAALVLLGALAVSLGSIATPLAGAAHAGGKAGGVVGSRGESAHLTTRPDLTASVVWVSDQETPAGYFHTYKVRVRNLKEVDSESGQVWGGPARGVLAQYTAPETTVVQSVTATNSFACTFSGRAVNCTGGAIDNGMLATVTIVVKELGPPDYRSITYCQQLHAAVVDPANAIQERDETNNSFSQTFFNTFCVP